MKDSYKEWLAGLIDGDGCLQISKKGYVSLEIVMVLRDKHCLFLVKKELGGSVKLKQGDNWLRYRLHHKEGILKLIFYVNGLIRNPLRLLQLSKICAYYNVCFIYPKPLIYSNNWLSGFFDSNGSVYLNVVSVQIFITISQKNNFLLEPLMSLYGGNVYVISKVNAFKWTVFRKIEVLNLVSFFKEHPLSSKKMRRILLIPRIYEAFSKSFHKAGKGSLLFKYWANLMVKWDNYK